MKPYHYSVPVTEVIESFLVEAEKAGKSEDPGGWQISILELVNSVRDGRIYLCDEMIERNAPIDRRL